MNSPKMFSSARKLWISALLLLIFWLPNVYLSDEVVERCKDKGCNVEVADATNQDLRCNTSCRQHQCFKGCALWRVALVQTCLTSCGNTSEESVKMQFCMLGCQRAVEVYERGIQDKLGSLAAPYAVDRTPKSVLLGWNRTQLPNVTYNVQRRYADLEGGDWEDHHDVQWEGDDRLNVTHLHPFISYNFRIVAVISNRTHVNSAASGPIATHASGAPSSKPKIVSLISSSTSIHIRWAAPFFKNGKLLNYRLQLHKETSAALPIVKDIPLGSDVSDVITEIITTLEPNTEYEVTLAARNRFGLGPEASDIIATLPKEERSGETPYLIMGSEHKLRQHNLLEESDPGLSVLYNDSYTSIIDVAIHYYHHYIFFSNTSGFVFRMDRRVQNEVRVIYNSPHHPGPLSVDWLHDKLYIGEDSEIKSCGLDGSSCIVVLDNLPSPPLSVVADPYNGYLYWSHAKPPGLYRIDLADLGTSLSDPFVKYRVLHRQQERFTTFAVDYVNYRLYYPVNASTTIRSSNLDGTEEKDVRHTIQTTLFVNIESMVMHNDRFYWTDRSMVFYEDFEGSRFYHNQLLVFDKPFTGLNVWHPSAQPIPVPLQPPRNLQAIFSSNSTTLQWERPDWDQGQGAWQDWWYQVEVTGTSSRHVKPMLKNCTSRHLKITDLQPQTAYSFRVRAYTSGGHGPWADPFDGETLKNDGSQPYLVYSVSGTIHQVGLDGTKTQDVLQLHSSNTIQQLMMVNGWYIWLDSENFVYIKMGALARPQRIPNISKVLVIAYDWLGEKLYWWNTQNQISRSSLDGHDVENVYQGISSAYHLSIDSREGYMYWATGNTVEVAHLDNKGHQIIRILPQFIFYTLGLTLDLDHRTLYWLAKEHQRTIVYSCRLLSRTEPTLGPVIKVTEMDSPPHQSIQGMHYYSNRLFWLSSHGNIVVMDTAAHNVARLELPSSGQNIASLSLIKPINDMTSGSPAGNRTAAVIPASVASSSVNITGPWYAFNISWAPTPVPNEEVYYTVQLTYGQNEQVTNETLVPYLLVANLAGIRPFSRVKLTMQSCSYWGCSERTERDLMTPMAPPSQPLKPRGFVTFLRMPLALDYNVELELHWWRPAFPNGRLVNYSVIYQISDNIGIWRRESIMPEHLSFSIPKVLKNHIYQLKVSACNEVGCSNQSEVVLVDTSRENPVPKLITTNDSKISLFLPDAQRSSAVRDARAIALTFEAQESALYLLDRSSHIIKLLATKEDHEVLDVTGRGKSIAMDWVGRDLYWMEEGSNSCEIRTYNIDSGDTTTNRVLQMEMSGVNLAVDPYHSTIFWSVMGPGGQGGIMKSKMNSNVTVPVIGYAGPPHKTRVRRASPRCNCPGIAVTSVFVMDHSQTNHNEFYTVEKTTGSVWAIDQEGCDCRLVVNATGRQQELGLPPDSMTVDHMYLYWSNSDQGELHSVLKSTGQEHIMKKMEGVKQILAYGSHLQPFPDPECLSTNNYEEAPTLKKSFNTSLVLRLEPWRPAADKCSNMSLPRTRYIVRYRRAPGTTKIGPCRPGREKCLQNVTTYELAVTLTGLHPDTFYIISVEADNFLTRHEGERRGTQVIFKTSPGVPSEPLNASAIARTPERVDVQWRVPKVLNGPLDKVQYEIIHFNDSNKSSHKENRTLVQSSRMQETNGLYAYKIEGLQPKTSYTFHVIAFSREDRSMGESHSRPAMAKTLSPPAEATIKSPGQTWVDVMWKAPQDGSIKRHSLIIVKVNDKPWSEAHPAVQTVSGMEYNDTFTGLEPNTQYAIYVNATYAGNINFLWPHKASDTVKTLHGKPGKPSPPFITRKNGDVITWTPPKDGGVPIDQYKVLAKRSDELNWTLVYNGTEAQWVLRDLEPGQTYVFSVMAHNPKGWGQPSEPSKEISYDPVVPAAAGITQQLTVILGVFFVVIFLVVALLVALLLGTRYMRRHKPVPVDVVSASTRREGDRELATLRILPSTQTQTNALYAINIVPTEADVAALPHFGRGHLKLTKFLGSGAFGEVFEGVAKDILAEDNGDTKVAVKTLRKGASGAEKEEFLKEALLMQNFRHTHILRLLGVCLENDPQFIILELMEGGDLLSYLRNARPTSSRQARLTMTDMVAMCTDVAKGCKYLEDMHFVHRDLAARNCLVSSLDPTRRVVKIGDFGLARDIYKNDYYRKEGEGLLPVRWMSPESLIDGVFTTYSDVWAFGVLMWEVLTLGQQPYPARTNIEVLNYVRGGGRLDRPDNCPDDMYSAMLKCWCFSPGGRPSFNYLLSELETIKRRGVESANHYTTTDTPGGSVAYAAVRPGLVASGVQYTDISANKQLPNGQLRNRDNDATYVGPQTPSRPPHSQPASTSRPRPSAHQDHSPYLEPVATPGGPNKYLELLGDGAVSSSNAPASSSSRGSSAIPPAAATATNNPSSHGLDYSHPVGHSIEGVGDSDNPSTVDSGPESPYLSSRVNPGSWCHRRPKGSTVDYAHLSLSDDLESAPDTDSESTSEQLHQTRNHQHHPYKNQQHHSSKSHHHRHHHPGGSLSSRPGWSHRTAPGGGNQTQYAQIASTDSDTDNEIFDRSRPQLKPKDTRPVPPAGPPQPHLVPTPDSTSVTSQEEVGPSHGHGDSTSSAPTRNASSHNHQIPFTIDGYLAPRSLCALGKQGQSSSSINSNLSNISVGQSSC